jgi:hypothetical protein
VPYPREVTTPASSCPGIDGVRSRSRRSVQVEGHAISVGTNPDGKGRKHRAIPLTNGRPATATEA